MASGAVLAWAIVADVVSVGFVVGLVLGFTMPGVARVLIGFGVPMALATVLLAACVVWVVRGDRACGCAER